MTMRLQFYGIERKVHADELDYHLENLEMKGFSLIENVLPVEKCKEYSDRLDRLNDMQNKKFGVERLKELQDYGVVRDAISEDPSFHELIVNPMVLAVVERTVGATAILHLQNGIVLEPHLKHHQAAFHRDFAKDFVADKVLAINCMYLIDEFTHETGGTWVVPYTHKSAKIPSDRYLQENEMQIVGKPGSLFVFDGLLVHRAGDNKSQNKRRSINQMYTRPFIKQQMEYAKQLEGKVDHESRLAQILGMWTLPPKDVYEFRVDPDKRTYRKNQG